LRSTYRLVVRKAKSEAGTDRRPPIAELLRPILLAARLRAGRPDEGRVCAVSVMSGKLAKRATEAWATASKRRRKDRLAPLERITLHECRHTYASFLMAAGYTLKELMRPMTRPRDLGIAIGALPSGRHNAITSVSVVASANAALVIASAAPTVPRAAAERLVVSSVTRRCLRRAHVRRTVSNS
jgi:hypothetical protein